MCGICGYIGVDNEVMISRMTETLGHRGPDDSDTTFFRRNKVGFGHRRLSILDLSKAGRQPMFTKAGNICIVFNGEIYNFPTLKKELEKSGVHFISKTDTEVILACYEKYGIEMVSRLNGIFAFALFDKDKEKVYLVRDHVGVKPLYYTYNNGKLIFASEIKAILASNIITPEIDLQAIWDYLTFNYIPCPQTAYKGIRQLPPAHILAFDCRSCEYRLTRYWNPIDPAPKMLADEKEVDYLVKKTLSDTVKEQLISDVPVGAFLSGGVDSNIIVGLMGQHSSQRVKSYTAIFSDEKASYFNEQVQAARVARKFNTIHHELEIPTPSMDDIVSMLSFTDQPFGNPTLFLSYLISKELKKSVTVALSGAGGDELFCGYHRYMHYALVRNIVKFLPINGEVAASLLLRLWPSQHKPELRNKAYKFFYGFTDDESTHYLRWAYFLSETQKKNLLNCQDKEKSKRFLDILFKRSQHLSDITNQLEYVDLNSYLVDDILEYTDKSSMAASLEVRVPFLSPKMVELSFRIPSKMKVSGGITKKPLRRVFNDFIPEENLKAPKKGFSAPTRIWAADMDNIFREVESRLPKDCPLNIQGVKRLREVHNKGRYDYGQTLFSLLMLELWMADNIFC